MDLNDTIPNAEIDEAEAAGACREALAWLREQPRTYSALIAQHPDWVNWQATSLASRGDYAQAETWAAASEAPAYRRGECAEAAAGRGDYAQAESWAAASDHPAYWRGQCAKAAAHRGERYPY